ncbi:MAG: DF family (seleno)protein [Solirubrobacterales bacterium]
MGGPRTPTIELLWWSGCPSWQQAIEELGEEMRAVGLDSDALVVREVSTEGAAHSEGFIGSPTIRIDGRDIQDPGDEPLGLTCRVYRLRDGRYSPLPDRADVRAALTLALSGQ